MVGFILFLICGFFVGFLLWKGIDRDDRATICGFSAGILLCIALIIFVQSKQIHPIDVYRGKTTLEITYKDGIPVDTIVVWK